MNDRRISKFLSLVLRHQPELLGITLDPAGWTDVAGLLARMAAHDPALAVGMDDLERIVAEDAKGRYSLRDGRIRANQGHSVEGVNPLDMVERTPPERLFHGTTTDGWRKIQDSGGLARMSRHHVHLSGDRPTAVAVGKRRRRKVTLLLEVDAARMHADGFAFYRSDNGVWHCDEVPVEYLSAVDA